MKNSTENATVGAGSSGQSAGGGAANMANSLVVIALCVTWPLVSRMLKHDLYDTSAPSSSALLVPLYLDSGKYSVHHQCEQQALSAR